MITLTYIALVLDSVSVVDGVGRLVGDLGNLPEPLEVLEEGEELLPNGRIEQDFLCSLNLQWS